MRRTRILALALIAALTAGSAHADALGTAFTYQGRLTQGPGAVNQLADMRFSLWTAAAGGAQLGGTLEFSGLSSVDVENGLFTVELDFGVAAFDGQDVYLEIAVRVPAGGGAYTTLSPRQRLSATPYALQTRGLYVDAALNVGIGTTTPTCDLDVLSELCVRGGTGTNGAIEVRDNNGQLDVDITSSTVGGGSVELFNISGQPRAQLIASQGGDNGGYLWLRQADGQSGVIVDGEANGNGSGLVSVRNINGTESVALIGGPNGAATFRDGAGTPRVEIGSDDTQVSLYANNGAPLARLWGTIGDEEGTLELYSQEDGLGVRAYATPFGGGFIETWDAGGDRAFLFDSDAVNGGALTWMYDRNEAVSLGLAADVGSTGGARLWLNNLANQETVELLASGNNTGGNVYVRNNTEETTVELRGDEGGQGSGYIGVFNRTGTNNFAGIGMDALDQFSTGARILMRASNGTDTVELDGEDGGHGEIALWDNTGTRTFRFFGNTMTIYNDAGAATWSINGNGAKNAIVETRDYGQRLMYTMESPEVWFEDVGSAQLVNGSVVVPLDPMFLQTVTINEQHPIKVFVTLTDDCQGVFVKKGADHFVVTELGGGKSNATFDYRVMAKRVGFENTRLEPFVEEPDPAGDAYIAPLPPPAAPRDGGADDAAG